MSLAVEVAVEFSVAGEADTVHVEVAGHLEVLSGVEAVFFGRVFDNYLFKDYGLRIHGRLTKMLRLKITHKDVNLGLYK